MKPDQFIGFYPCHDLSATRDFYERDLGLDMVRDQETCLIFRATKRAFIGFCQHDGDLPHHKGLIITLVLEDVDGFYKRLKQLGVETEAPPKLNEHYGIYHFFARDPDGYRLEIQCFLTPLS